MTIKADPKQSAYGFVLELDEFEKIAKDEILSAKEFFKRSFYKKQKQMEWITDDKTIFEEMEPLEEDEENLFEINHKKKEEDVTLEAKIDILKKNISNLEFALINMKNILIDKIK